MALTINTNTALATLAPNGHLSEPTATVLGNPIATWSKDLYTNEAGTLTTGFWRASPGTSRWEFAEHGEVIHVLGGRMTVHQDDSEPQDLGPGDVAAFPIGWRGTWTIYETLSKFYVIYH
ncbi:cupin domain-containing protein [Streptomyces sp. NPDC056159]|uniref:cupin domain-containing protein n=1 Tax=Streptomyces sp. NPDC056159 TaxID=3155537 RepID=UPI00343859ED